MCNLYRMTKSPDEVARWFSTVNELGSVNIGSEVYPGYPGIVIAGGELRQMTWGFPLTLKSKKTGKPLKPKPVNNTRSEKLDSFMWKYSFEERRCLIPLTAWAEAEGARGAKTRTWLSLPDAELFTVGGIWRDSDEFGLCYSMVMTDAADNISEVHNRMPVILAPDEREIWTHGASEDARELCRPCSGDFEIAQTDDAWHRHTGET
ncbi:SOS response-associated peptidase [Erythrobacter ani]|uniref:Abasic site processing protein n=1 Tax=Erythrobacter ani TaxID=2827235 RepID=A0ABS6SR80_9SPHN|nr:SOS response-associated peptidase family protein [Erythrobacter ani]MBV7267550.1 SOS response-associated peptidase family protein [Erythrobacter ani]